MQAMAGSEATGDDVQPTRVHGGRIVVGVDGSSVGAAAMPWAADKERRRGATLR
ncbi:MAG: hypothetical protein NVSMB32_01050 [Actinomycetota bacterium]